MRYDSLLAPFIGSESLIPFASYRRTAGNQKKRMLYAPTEFLDSGSR